MKWPILFIGALCLVSASAYFFESDESVFALYAWERPEDLKFLQGERSSIYFYALGIEIRSDSFDAVVRRNPLKFPSDATLIPVVRIDVFSPDRKIGARMDAVVGAIIDVCKGFYECQIDHDAVDSGTEEYAVLLTRLKEAMPEVKLSITALASWCTRDSWLSDVKIDYAVPMLYRMGADDAQFRRDAGLLSEPKCGSTIALSLDELNFDPRPHVADRRVYLFNPRPWTANAYEQIRESLGR